MIHFMCREARPVYDVIRTTLEGDLARDRTVFERVACDQAVLMFGGNTALAFVTGGEPIEDVLKRKSTMHDFPTGLNLADLTYLESYRYFTEQFVTRDYTRIELLKMAGIIREFPLKVIGKIGNRCKHLDHFTIPYLGGALAQEGSEVIEGMRTEQRLNELASNTKRLDLPDVRPFRISERLTELAEDRKFDDIERNRFPSED